MKVKLDKIDLNMAKKTTAAKETKKVSAAKASKKPSKYSVAPFIKEFYPEYYSIETYPADKCVTFNAISDEWGILGNFAHTPLEIEGVKFPTSEHLFQVMKFKQENVVRNVYEGITYRGIKKGTVKMVAKSYETPGLRREDWGRMIVDAIKFCLQTKFEQSPEFRDKLLSSKGFYIIEDQTTRKKGEDATADTWGALLRDGSYVGPNLLGRLLMELRDNGKLEYNLPEDAFEFLQYLKG